MRHSINAKKLAAVASIAAGTLLLQACATTATNTSALKNRASAKANSQSDTTGLDPVASAAFWGTRYDREPQNAEVAVKFSGALRKIGSHKESLKVMSKAANLNPDNTDVMLEFGKSLIESDRAFEAVRPIEFALSQRPDDWRILSAYGVALDQIGEHESAREHYNLALSIDPTNVSVLNNKGLSFALSGDLEMARNTLVRATGDRRAISKVRQNLALVMALKGDIKSAERLARSDLPPQLADNNVEIFRTLLKQPAYWQDFAASNVSVPDFDAAPAVETPSVAEIVEPANVPTVPVVEPAPLPALKEKPAPAAPAPVLEEPAPRTVEPELDDVYEDDGVPLVLGPVTPPSAVSLEAPAEYNDVFYVDTDPSPVVISDTSDADSEEFDTAIESIASEESTPGDGAQSATDEASETGDDD